MLYPQLWSLCTMLKSITDAPKSYVIIFAFLSNERLAVYGCFLVLGLRISTQKYFYFYKMMTSILLDLPICCTAIYYLKCNK